MNFLRGAARFMICTAILYLLIKGLFLSGWVTGYIQQIILLAFIVILNSLGLNVIYGYTGQFSLGQALSTVWGPIPRPIYVPFLRSTIGFLLFRCY